MSGTIRINKRMAELGLCSRREADALITAGHVTVNGTIAVLGQAVTVKDTIMLNHDLAAERVYLAYYKGRGVISHSPDQHEVDIATKLQDDYGLSDLYPVGRLDKDSEGLMIITNDGRITKPLLDPESNIKKTYEVLVDKPITGFLLKKLAEGVSIEGYKTKPAETTKLNEQRLTLTLTEGKKHQVRRMCAALGYQVQSLKRVQIASIELAGLKPNQYRKLKGAELKQLLATLNLS